MAEFIIAGICTVTLYGWLIWKTVKVLRRIKALERAVEDLDYRVYSNFGF